VTVTSQRTPTPRSVRGTALKALADQRVRFLIVGGFNTALGPVLFVALHFSIERTVGYIGVFSIAYVIAVFEAFIAYRYIVFRVRGSFLLDLARFSLLYVGLYFVNIGGLWLLVSVAGLPVLLGGAVVFPAVVVLTYLGNSHFSFRRAPKARG
jgi:putative flippase GtrA